MGNGARTEFWYDPWIQRSTMMETFPRVKIRDTDIPRNTKNYKISPNIEDKIDWKVMNHDKFSVSKTWNVYKEHHSCPPWIKILWGKNSIPRHNFILWLALKRRLRTKDKLKNWGITPYNDCVQCTNGIETIEHCFFECDMAVEVWRIFLPICRTTEKIETWRRMVSWFCRKATGKNILANIRRVTFASVVYALWNVRNRKFFLKETSYSSTIVRRIRNILLDKFNGYSTSATLNEILRCIQQFCFLGPEAFVLGLFFSGFLSALRSIQKGEAEGLLLPFAENEIYAALFACTRKKAPGPDTFIEFFDDFHRVNTLPQGMNTYFMVLVPKVVGSANIKYYRPISLGNAFFNFLFETLSLRWAPILSKVISDSHHAF
ncbi:uncharacterized protein LOC126681854 [Mercurialis annua]|uniref:uncharacterized protein LOC126681854 n=1 Tax=Mercurialis annua TaxID=3986 RepID=UPI002160BC7F|nr:uncharacterized protein LOC126681854 [Mercurialis annua]